MLQAVIGARPLDREASHALAHGDHADLLHDEGRDAAAGGTEVQVAVGSEEVQRAGVCPERFHGQREGARRVAVAGGGGDPAQDDGMIHGGSRLAFWALGRGRTARL
jgi:hypothetical protein